MVELVLPCIGPGLAKEAWRIIVLDVEPGCNGKSPRLRSMVRSFGEFGFGFVSGSCTKRAQRVQNNLKNSRWSLTMAVIAQIFDNGRY